MEIENKFEKCIFNNLKKYPGLKNKYYIEILSKELNISINYAKNIYYSVKKINKKKTIYPSNLTNKINDEVFGWSSKEKITQKKIAIKLKCSDRWIKKNWTPEIKQFVKDYNNKLK